VSVIKDWNAVTSVTVGRNVQPGQKIDVGVFGINGPLSDQPTNYIGMRLAMPSFDGMQIDTQGNLYVTAPDGVLVPAKLP